MSPVVNKDLGPCIVTWDPNGVNIDFMLTHGGVIFRYEELRAPIQRDQAGLTHVDEVTTGCINPELEVPLTEPDLTKLEECFANATATASFLKVRNPVGEAVFVSSKPVIAKPIQDGVVSTTETQWVQIHRAFPRVAMEQTYDSANQRVTKVIFKGFPDDQSGKVDETWRHGPDEE